MKICGIIAEYNPLHNGHVYQIGKARELTGCDYVVVCMSGDFVQRGIPAICDKYNRTRMALMAGADAVFELPCAYATGSLSYFAKAGVNILGMLGCDYLSFGSESGNIDDLRAHARMSKEYERNNINEIADSLRNGQSYAKALGEEIGSNDRLAYEYINAIDEFGFDMKPFCVKREGQYLDTDISSGSATAIREAICNGQGEQIYNYMPDYAISILNESTVWANDFSDLLYGKLTTLCIKENKDILSEYQDVSSNIAGHIMNEIGRFSNFDNFAKSIHSAEYTRGRINRSLIHLMLELKKDLYDDEYIKSVYARLLGFNKNSSPVLNELKKRSSIPIISKCADAGKLLNKKSAALFDKDIAASNIYDYIVSKKIGRACIDENAKAVIIVK